MLPPCRAKKRQVQVNLGHSSGRSTRYEHNRNRYTQFTVQQTKGSQARDEAVGTLHGVAGSRISFERNHRCFKTFFFFRACL